LLLLLLLLLCCIASFCLRGTADDSMHGTITPNNRFLNDVIGATCVSLYAWFDYRCGWVLKPSFELPSFRLLWPYLGFTRYAWPT
jgi:hypothetical protein